MLSLYSPSLCNKQPLTSLPKLSFITMKKKSTWLAAHGDCPVPSWKTSTNLLYSQSTDFVVRAVEKDSQQYEINPDKAKEALKELDQQLQTLSKKQVSPPKIRASEVKLTRDEMTEVVTSEFPSSVLITWATALFIFTIFYNVLFYTVIKPSIDGPESGPSPATTTTTTIPESASPEIAVLQLLPTTPETFLQVQGGNFDFQSQ